MLPNRPKATKEGESCNIYSNLLEFKSIELLIGVMKCVCRSQRFIDILKLNLFTWRNSISVYGVYDFN